MDGKLRLQLALHGLFLLLISSLPFFSGVFRVGSMLLWLLLLVWPVAAFLSPFLLAARGTSLLFSILPVPIFFLLPMCVLLTPMGLRMLGAYPVFYAVLAAAALPIGRRRLARRTARSRGQTMGI